MTITADIDEDAPIERGDLDRSLGFLLRLAQLRAFGTFYDRLAGLGLKPGEFTVLWVIHLNPGLRQGAIARELIIKPAHMTKLIGRLADAGLVRRRVPPDDRRSVRLSLTRMGEDFVAAHRAAFFGLIEAERGSLNDDEFDQLTRLLKRVAAPEGDRA